MMARSKKYGLLGEKLSHSLSPQLHSYYGKYDYKLMELAPEKVDEFFDTRDFCGINVTIPYKKVAFSHCDTVSDTAKTAGAVNTVINRGGKLCGYNTDYYGFEYLLEKSGINVNGKKVIVLGSGGASVTVQNALKNNGARVTVISRSGKDNYENIAIHSDADVIVNTTPVGMYPKTDAAPLDLEVFKKLSGVIDIIYNPLRTRLLLDAKRLGIPYADGLPMLAAQGFRSAELFLDKQLPPDLIETAEKRLRLFLGNIVLIGMPGCGKTSIGKEVARKLKKEFIDTDKLIEQRAGMTIPEIFEASGEETFRRLESEIVAELAKKSGAVIATGGGTVTREQNREPLCMNGTVVFIKRDISLLPKKGRPVSQQRGLMHIWAERKKLYENFADIIVEGEGVKNLSHQIVGLVTDKNEH